MPDSSHLLLVEGINDKHFYEEFCKVHALDASVTVAAPRDVGGRRNSKQGAIKQLSILLPNLADADSALKRLGLILDADQIADGGGFARTVAQVGAKLAAYGFQVAPTALASGGLLFHHGDGLADVGLWVMPDNQGEGMLEDWIGRAIRADDLVLLRHAQATVADLHEPRFQAVRRSKAELATWLAWQEKPGEGLYYALDGALLDPTHALYVGLKTWMSTIFPPL